MKISMMELNRLKRNSWRALGRTLVEQEFCYRSPGALRVQLVGSFTQWQRNPISMIRGEDGLWRARAKLAPGEYQYRFIVDGDAQQEVSACVLRVNAEKGL